MRPCRVSGFMAENASSVGAKMVIPAPDSSDWNSETTPEASMRETKRLKLLALTRASVTLKAGEEGAAGEPERSKP